MAKWASATTSQPVCSDVAGTFGSVLFVYQYYIDLSLDQCSNLCTFDDSYLAPEYILYGKVNEKIDIYAFGVVLLELLSGRKPISSGCPKGQESLVMWVSPPPVLFPVSTFRLNAIGNTQYLPKDLNN